VKQWHKLVSRARRVFNRNIYQSLYEAHAVVTSEDQAVGSGDYDLVGRIELALLRQEGLAPHHTLLDFGCGNGRLAVHAIPYLTQGRYIGVDISPRLIQQARRRVAQQCGSASCAVSWQVQTTPHYQVSPGTVDMLCAFSVFTHMEHEDSFLYLAHALPITRPGGKFVFSCLPLSLKAAQAVFHEQAAVDFALRWSQVRNVVTSTDLMSQIARLAGWEVGRWYAGDEANIRDETGQAHCLGQSSCVLRVPAVRTQEVGSA
jgi:SAM-dependent methyltransferase